MPPLLWRTLVVCVFLAIAIAGIDWGLPSRAGDAQLFASHRGWSGEELATFDAERVSSDLGADVDRDPIQRSTNPVTLTAGDPQRAQIVRRYKLFSHQPDEMITFMALQQMKPAAMELDPRLYQYGGLWIYPVGGLLKLCGVVGLIDLRSDKAFYYDNPEAFGRFYVVARCYTLAWYALGMWLCATAVKRLADNDFAAVVAAAIVAVSPVVFALAHEAKPHLPGAVLILAACLAADRWTKDTRKRDAGLAGALCGAAAGMVLSAAVGGIVLLVMVLLKRTTFVHRAGTFVMACAVAAIVFAVTNPYFILHFVQQDDVLKSNLANTKAMYTVGPIVQTLGEGGLRLVEAASLPVLLIAAAAICVFTVRRTTIKPLAWLIGVPAALVLLQFFAFAAGKPGEYGRFAIFPAIALSILAAWGLAQIRLEWLRSSALTLAPIAIFAWATLPYFQAFAADCSAVNTRTLGAVTIAQTPAPRTHSTIQIYAEPAPYSLPPVDPWRWRLVLTRPTDPPIGDVIVRPVDDPRLLPPPPTGYRRTIVDGDQRPAPITWANKPFEILTR